jgi:hypothetical protein
VKKSYGEENTDFVRAHFSNDSDSDQQQNNQNKKTTIFYYYKSL